MSTQTKTVEQGIKEYIQVLELTCAYIGQDKETRVRENMVHAYLTMTYDSLMSVILETFEGAIQDELRKLLYSAYTKITAIYGPQFTRT